MTRTAVVVVLLLVVSTACRRAEAPPYPTSFTDPKVQAGRIGRYLQDAVVPKLRSCWTELQGQGAVAVDLTFKKSGGNWSFDNATVKKSSLASGQDAVAQRCMNDAARETTFAVDAKEPLEAAAPQFVVRLGWSVPLPTAGVQMTDDQMARIIGGNGAITVPGCSACVSRKEYPYGLKCESRTSGSDKDCEEINSNTCATTPTACLRGAFSGIGGVYIF